MKRITIFTLCLTLFLVGSMSAKTVWVAATASGAANGTSQADAYGSFTTALNDITAAGDVLMVVGTVPAVGQILNAKNFQYSIEGFGSGATIQGVNPSTSRMFTINGASSGQNVTFKNLTFTGQNSNIAAGGAVLLSNQAGVTITFDNCRFVGNSLTSAVTTGGGALNFTNSTVIITGCLFKENQALRNGGAIAVNNTSNVTITGSTFYKNSTTDTTSSFGGGALYVNGTSAVVNIDHCTFFQNTIGHTNQDYGTIRSDNGNTTITNSLFYDNKVNNGTGALSDWGTSPNGTQTFSYSLGQSISANTDVVSNSIVLVRPATGVAANLTSSNLIYIDSLGKVIYNIPTVAGENSPIGFGSDGKDAGAWESPNTWTGTSSTTWSDPANWYVKGVPDATKDALIATSSNQPIIASNTSVKSLKLNPSTSLTVNSGFNLTVTDAVANSGTMTLENNANLIQVGTTNTNTGNIIVKRNGSPLKRLDYTLWSSPVTNNALFLKDFSPATLDNRFYDFNTTFNTGGVNGAYSEIASPSTTNFTAGKGYLIRMPDDADAVNPTAFPGEFTGVPNSGIVTVALVDGGAAGLRYNLVGNPYPSPIRMQNFVFDNTAKIESTLYFWRKTNGTGTAYCTWVAGPLVSDPGTFASNGNAQTVDPLNIIQTGQGFFVEAKSGATSLLFRNSHRVANNAGQFFRTKQAEQPNKIWLNATNATGDFSQTAITYFAGATIDVDAFDGKYINDSPIALTSNINGVEYTIQGRPAFDVSDVVALNFKTDKAGDYTISIDHFEGVFATGQDVYLVDSKTGAETDLKASSYTFSAIAGMDNARFSLKYQKTLKVDAPAFNENTVSVYKYNGAIYINSGKIAINSIQVYDVQGRLIADRKNVKSSTATLENLKTNNQVLLVKISGEDNSVVTKKVLN